MMTFMSRNSDVTKIQEDDFLRLIDDIKNLENKFSLDNRFNIFEAINMVTQEIRHSRFLAFLLDPSGVHGLGDRFLRAILTAAVTSHREPPLTRLSVAISDLTDATVYCERDHFDVTIQIPSLQVLFVIENKINATESDDQLIEYRKKAEKKYSELKFFGCFLTKIGYQGEDSQWGVMGYRTIASELKKIVAEAPTSDAVLIAINHYIHLIERKIMIPQDLIDACKKIYKAHKTAIDLIVENGYDSAFTQSFDEFLVDKDVKQIILRDRVAHFVCNSWINKERIQNVPSIDENVQWPDTFPILMGFEFLGDKLFLRLEIGPIKDRIIRTKIITNLRRKYNSNRVIKDNYTRIISISEKIEEQDSIEAMTSGMEKLWGKLIDDQIEQAVIDAITQEL